MPDEMTVASIRAAVRPVLPCFGERILPEGDDGGRSSAEMVGLGRELRGLDRSEL